jgi:hypothetical protein
MPQAGEILPGTPGYYMHACGHGTVQSGWPVFLEFMKKYLVK